MARSASRLEGILVAVMLLAASLAHAQQLVLNAEGHTSVVNKIRFTPDGRQLASVSNDKTIRFWDLHSGEAWQVLRPPIGPGAAGMLYALALSPDGQWLACGGLEYGGADHGIYLMHLPDGQIETVLRGHSNVVLDLAFSGDGKWLASASDDKTVRLWNLASRRSETILRGHRRGVYGVAFAPNSKRLATASLDHTARVWSVPSGASEFDLPGHTQPLQCVAWSPDGKLIATGGADATIRLWQTADGKLRKRFEELGNHVTSVAFSSNSRELLYTLGGPGSSDGGYLIDLDKNRRRLAMARHRDSVTAGAWSRDGSLAATADGLGEIHVWRTTDGSHVHRLAGRGHTPWSAGWSPQGPIIAWGNTSQYVHPNNRGPLEQSFDLSQLEFVDTPRATARARTKAGQLTLEPSGTRAVLVKRSNQPVSTLKLSSEQDTLRCFSLLGDNVVVGSDFGLFLYDAASGQIVRQFHGHTGVVWAVAPSPDGRFLLSASEDKTLRIWRPDRNTPLVSLFVADQEWIAWTPQGYYAASPGGERLMGWHINHGPDRLGEFHPAERFRKSLFRPDLLRTVLQTGGVEEAFQFVSRGRPATEIQRVEQVLPPQVTIVSPAAPTVRVDDSKLVVKASATVSGSHPITALRLLLNGRPYEGQAGLQRFEPQTGPVEATWNIELTPGRHRLSVQAESAVSKAISDVVEVRYIGGASSTTETPEPAELPSLYVLAVGVSAYGDESLRLSFADRDAKAVEQSFRERSRPLYRRVETMVLTDAEATQRNIVKGLTWFKRQMTQRDVGVIFFAGHGQKDEQGIFYLLPADVDLADVAATAVPEERLRTTIQGTPGRVMLMLDACHSGAVAGDKRRANTTLTDELIRDLLTDDYGTVVMCSSMGREFSFENNQLRHGNFAAAVVEGLQGKADLNQDQVVYLNELDLYVADRVKELSQGRQHPVTQKPTSIRSFPLAKS